MRNIRNVHPSVRIDSELLKKDRMVTGFTQASLSAACESVSLATIRRAEQGHRIIEASLNRIADTLECPRERYILQNPAIQTTEGALSLTGGGPDYMWKPIEVSRLIAVRQDSLQYARYLAEAKACAKVECGNYRMRKLVENGYDLSDAITMLAALKSQQN